jgi:5-methylcytosine-specific restriction enzyme subunit McrC
MNIPIQNIYYLLCYAWNKLDESNLILTDIDDYQTLLDLFAKVLHEGTVHILKAGIDRNYVSNVNIIPGIKGKLLFDESIKANTFIYGRAACEYDDLSSNILHNQILKTTIGTLIHMDGLDRDIKDSLRVVYKKLVNIDEIKISKKDFSLLRFHRNNIYYSFLMNICEFIFDSVSLNENNGKYEFIDFIRDERKMAILFEAFILNFYKKEAANYKVGAPKIYWNAIAIGNSTLDYLPEMKTDIVLESSLRTIIIDTKYYKEVMKAGQYGKRTFNRDNLFQIYSYVQNYDKTTTNLEGMLLYPTVNDEVSQQYLIHGKKISINTINLNQNWKEIDRKLKDLVKI